MLSILNWFNALEPTQLVVLLIAMVLVLLILAVAVSSAVTAKRIKDIRAADKSAGKPDTVEDNPEYSDSDSALRQNEAQTAYTEVSIKQDIKLTGETLDDTKRGDTESQAVAVSDTEVSKPKSSKIDKTMADGDKPQTQKTVEHNITDSQAQSDAGSEIAETVEEIQSNDRKSGKIVIYKDDGGKFYFSIVAANHEPVGHSMAYSTKSACKMGLKAMLKYRDTEVYDLTLLKNTFIPKIGTASLEIYQDDNGKYYFRLRSKNYRLVLSSQDYTTKSACQTGIDAVKRISENYSL